MLRFRAPFVTFRRSCYYPPMAKGRTYFGLTPWGGYFLDAMEGLADEARLSRGKSYAKNERLLSFSLDNSLVKAKIRGNYRSHYNVLIGFRPFTEQEKRIVLSAVENDPMLLGRILAGELPLELSEQLSQAGVNLLPSSWRDMKRACSCPDYGDPCKHMAAVYYTLAREIDRHAPDLLVNKFGFSYKLPETTPQLTLFGSAAMGNALIYIGLFIFGIAFPLLPTKIKSKSGKILSIVITAALFIGFIYLLKDILPDRIVVELHGREYFYDWSKEPSMQGQLTLNETNKG